MQFITNTTTKPLAAAGTYPQQQQQQQRQQQLTNNKAMKNNKNKENATHTSQLRVRGCRPSAINMSSSSSSLPSLLLSPWSSPSSAVVAAMLALLLLLLSEPAAAGSCREAQLCCSGRDSSCVVQKAPINAIIEDLSDKPCYCDHACLKLGDCCDDFKDHCGVLDCQVSDWGQWSECDKSCGTGMMSRARRVLQPAQNGGKHCPSLVQKRGCQGFRCHGHRDKKILREMALLLPAALSRSRHANDSSDIRRNLRMRYRDSYKHNREHEYCVEFEVIKASKACHKLPPYNKMLEGDRITVRCDLEALVQDSTGSNNNPMLHSSKFRSSSSSATGNTSNNRKTEITNNSAISDDDPSHSDDGEDDEHHNNNNDEANEDDVDDEENMLDNDENYEYEREAGSSMTTPSTSTTTTTTTTTPRPPPAAGATTNASSYHCRGEGLPGRTTRWSALAAPSCRGKWLRLTVGPPKKCTHSQFIFV